MMVVSSQAHPNVTLISWEWAWGQVYHAGGVFIRWNGTVEWNGGMERWNGIMEWNGGIVE